MFVEFEPIPMPGQAGMPPESALGARLQAARTHYDLSGDALSRLTKPYDEPEQRGVSATALLRYEAGEALPATRELRILCEALGIPADWLIFGTTKDRAVSVAEQLVFAGLRMLHRDNAQRQAMGEDLALTMDQNDARVRARRIEEARRRP